MSAGAIDRGLAATLVLRERQLAEQTAALADENRQLAERVAELEGRVEAQTRSPSVD